jgi:DNA-binding CsgD family transcriptional regulator
MGRDRSEQTFPDLFATDAVRDASKPPPLATKDAAAQPEPQRHVLPKNLRNAVKHLNDEELDLLHAATLEERKRRGRLQPNVEADSAQTSRHANRSPIKDKISQRRRVDIAETTLTLGQINAVRAAFRAGITPARIARQFGISQSNVRKALATDESKG